MTGSRVRWAALLGAAAVASAALAATGWFAPAASRQVTPRPAAQDVAGCTILQAENEHDGPPTTLRLLSLPDGTTKRVTQAGFRINAMGYSASQGVVYGVAEGIRHDHNAHAVRIGAAGEVTDLGVVGRAGARRPVSSLITGATAGAVAGNRWYVRQDSDLYTVDIDPASPDYVRVVHRTALRPVSLAVGVDDFAYDPADGLLYGVSTTSRGDDSVVTLDPASGKVVPVPGLRFPRGGAYGSVVLGPGAFYATANRDGHRSVLYRLPRDGSGPAVEVVTGPALASSDAAGCFTETPPPSPVSSSAQPPPPPPTTQLPSPTPTQLPSPTPTPTTATATPSPNPPPESQLPRAEQPVVPTTRPVPTSVPSPTSVATPTSVVTSVPPTSTPTSKPTSKPTSTVSKRHTPPTEKPQPVVADTAARTHEKRRWGLTALILVLGGGAAMAHVRRHR